MSSWSIEQELQTLTRTRDTKSALVSMDLITEDCTTFEISTQRDWYRSGSETYIYEFSIKTATNEQTMIVKACTPSTAVKHPEHLLMDWIRRRKLLAQCGVNVPRLYTFGRGVLIEEMIPHLAQQYARTNPHSTGFLISDVAQIAAALIYLGFNPIAPFADLRTDGSRAFCVDFGSDLGPEDQPNPSSPSIIAMAKRYLSALSVPTTDLQSEIEEKMRSLKPI